jgi:hypothetical protein
VIGDEKRSRIGLHPEVAFLARVVTLAVADLKAILQALSLRCLVRGPQSSQIPFPPHRIDAM